MDPIAQLTNALSGRYAIEREIGAGGMATVYLAKDLRHNRSVALKLLNPELGAVLGVERFLAEIQVTANLQHPNLLPLFDSGEADGLLFYVMPFIEGESLRARLTREKQLPVDEAVRMGVAIASALDYAHRHGVIHRDLKPENILLHEGQPLIADFGIALAVSNAGGNRITQTGLSLGTPQYMSPEQATGDRVIDGRTDIYSLGAVLYEMLVGDPPHLGSTSQAVIAKVLTDRPRSVRVSRPAVPEYVEAAIDRALEKLPADRFATAKDFSDALQAKTTMATSSAVSPQARRRAIWREPAFLVAAGVALAAAATSGWLATSRGKSAGPPSAFRFILTPSKDVKIVDASTWAVNISPDGQTLLFTGQNKAGRPQLYSRGLDQIEAKPIAGTDFASQPVFSPDGRWIAFQAENKLRKVPIEGGPATTLGDIGSNNGLDWSTSDFIVLAAEGNRHGLAKMPATGGTPVEFTHVDKAKKELDHLWPIALADGKTVIFTIYYGSNSTSRLAVASLDGGDVTPLDVQAIGALGVVGGNLLYVRPDGAVLGVPFNQRARKVEGSATPLLEGVTICGPCNGDAKIRVSRNGSVIFMSGSSDGNLVWRDASGRENGFGDRRGYVLPRVSPDGRRIAVNLPSQSGVDVWIYDLGNKTLSRLTNGGLNMSPEWLPDGRVMFYSDHRVSVGGSAVDGKSGEYAQPADGSGPAVLIYPGAATGMHTVSPDGKYDAYVEFTNNNLLIRVRALAGDTVPKDFVGGSFFAAGPRWSPDGKRLAYVSNESGVDEVYVRSFPDLGGRVQISTNGGGAPMWSHDGKSLFYVSGNGYHAARLSLSPTLTVTARDSLFDRGAYFYANSYQSNYDIDPKTGSFLFVKTDDAQSQVTVIGNWIEDVKAAMRKGR